MLRNSIRISSFTMACTGSTKEITGTPVPGTTALGVRLLQRWCPCLSCVFLCGTTGIRPCIFAIGGERDHHAGVIIGAMIGDSSEVDGIGGIVVPLQRPHRCRSTNEIIPGSATPKPNSSGIFTTRITVTSRAIILSGSTMKRRRCKGRLRQRDRGRRKCLRKEVKGHRTVSVQPCLRLSSRAARKGRPRHRDRAPRKQVKGRRTARVRPCLHLSSRAPR